MNLKSDFLQRLSVAPACLVTVTATRGSVPREAGTWMAVWADDTLGTIGGGRLEWDAIAKARSILVRNGANEVCRYPLGPSLGQCCGGEVQLQFEIVTANNRAKLEPRLGAPNPPVALFGGGHVGRALVQVLGQLPLNLRWIDSRDEIFPLQVPDNVHCEHSEPVHAAVTDLAPQSQVLIMSFSHTEDLDIVAACLMRHREYGDLPFVGLIGSKTKWASFRQRLQARGFSAEEMTHVTCPIGVPGIADKRPEVIAVGVAAQLLQQQYSGQSVEKVYTL